MREIEIKLDVLMPMITAKLAAGQNVHFSPIGVSMLPMLRQNIDSVVLSPKPEKLKKYDIPLYKRDDGKYVLHRVIAAADNYTCCGDNQYAYEKGIRDDQIIAVVSSFYRKNKRHSVNEIPYRVYCSLWHNSRPLRHFCKRIKGWLKRHFNRLLKIN